jgi:hypothetical protein
MENTASGYDGSITYKCRTDGTWEKANESCTTQAPIAKACPGEFKKWTVGTTTCEGFVTSVPIDQPSYASDSASPTTGSAKYMCQSDGTWLIDSATKSCITSSNVEPEPSINTQVKCDLPKPSNGYLLDFTKGGTRTVSDLTLHANNGESDASLSYGNVSIGAGVYRVDLATYWNSTINQSYPYQQWKLSLTLTDGRELKTLATKDQNSATAIIQETLTTNLEVPIATKEVDAYHAGFPNSQGNPVVPLCATLTYLGAIPVAPTSSTAIHGQCNSVVKDGCTSGTYSDATDTTTQYIWKCKGQNAGTDALCYLKKPILETSSPQTYPLEEEPERYADELVDTRYVEEARPEIKNDDISGEYIKTELPEELYDVRREIIQQSDSTPFVLLKDASPLQRETLLRNWFSELQSEYESEEVGATSAPRTLPRFVREQGPEDSPREEDDSIETMEVLTNRSGLASITDRDGDGISDYDEKHIYGTNPEDPFTADSPLSDGERVLLGMDPQKPEIAPIVVESPKVTKNVVDETLYAIETIEFVQQELPEEEQEVRGIRIRGTAQPLAFVTLYVYSTPIIVTVQADVSGVFEYVLDTTLEDGTHEVYVASVNNSGKILAQSKPIPFVKTAQAIEYTPASVSGADPVDSATQLMLTLTFLFTLLIAGAGIVWIGMRHTHSEEGIKQPHENSSL